MRLGIQRLRARNLARIAQRVLMRSRIPVPRLPLPRFVAAQESRHVFRVEIVTPLPAILPPQIVVVQLNLSRLSCTRKSLPIDRAILRSYHWLQKRGNKLSRLRGTIIAADQESRRKLLEQCLLLLIRQPIVIAVESSATRRLLPCGARAAHCQQPGKNQKPHGSSYSHAAAGSPGRFRAARFKVDFVSERSIVLATIFFFIGRTGCAITAILCLGGVRFFVHSSGWQERQARNMKNQLIAVSLMLLCFTPSQASSQDAKDQACHIALPGITFTRSLNGAAAHAKVEDRRLTLASEARGDTFRDPNDKFTSNTAPLLLTEVDNRKPFTLTAKITPTFLKTYDAGALFIYVKDDLWIKLAMEMDERHKPRMVSVRTIGTSDDNDHDVIPEKSVYMKISSDTTNVGFYYSLDEKNWQLIRLFKNDYPASIWVGISAQSPIGEGTSVVFESLSLTPRSISDFRLGN